MVRRRKEKCVITHYITHYNRRTGTRISIVYDTTHSYENTTG